MREKCRGVVVVMAIGDILQVQHVYTVLGEVCRNVFYYEIGPSDTTSQLATPYANWFAANIAPEYQVFLADDNTHDRIIVDNLTNGLDFGEATTDLAGAVVGDPLPSFVALNVTLQRTSKLTRNGSKRFSGFVETALTQQNWTLPAGAVTAVNNICATSLSDSDFLGLGTTMDLNQVIVGRTKNASNVYELDLSKINNIGGILQNPIATSQRTRKA